MTPRCSRSGKDRRRSVPEAWQWRPSYRAWSHRRSTRWGTRSAPAARRAVRPRSPAGGTRRIDRPRRETRSGRSAGRHRSRCRWSRRRSRLERFRRFSERRAPSRQPGTRNHRGLFWGAACFSHQSGGVAAALRNMFDNLQDKMDRVFKTLRGEAKLNEWHIENALKEIRVALLEADVHFKVVKEFTNRVREKALGEDVLTAFSPAQQVTKVVRDELQHLLGGSEVGLALVGSPAVVMMTGLQGSGKTTTSGKLALHLKDRGRRPFLVPCDVYRPAAIEQLRVVANNVKVPFYELGELRDPLQIAKNAVQEA